ncbi:hypothetical protein D0851_16790 [Marinobacter sp. Arc7-DN-1]|nr:hypothetical protein D0851_16790 [Marinobacter sp. Arc7-DN-1]
MNWFFCLMLTFYAFSRALKLCFRPGSGDHHLIQHILWFEGAKLELMLIMAGLPNFKFSWCKHRDSCFRWCKQHESWVYLWCKQQPFRFLK